MDKSLIGHAVLALVATGAAFMAWSRPAQSEHDPAIVVVGGSVDRLTQVDWDEEGYTVTLKHHGDTTTVTSVNKKQPDDKHNVRDFPASDKGRDIETKLAPLKAARSLGKPEGGRLKEVGLDEPKQSLTLHFGDNATKLDVGSATYGSGSVYVRNSDGEVFLVPSTTISPFRVGGSSLIERIATPTQREHVERLTIKANDKTRELVHRNADDRGHSYFTDTDKTEEKDKIDKGVLWVDSVLRLRALAAADALPQTPPKVEVTFHCDDRKDRFVKIWEATGDSTVIATTLFPQGVTVAKSAAEAIFRDLPMK